MQLRTFCCAHYFHASIHLVQSLYVQQQRSSQSLLECPHPSPALLLLSLGLHAHSARNRKRPGERRKAPAGTYTAAAREIGIERATWHVLLSPPVRNKEINYLYEQQNLSAATAAGCEIKMEGGKGRRRSRLRLSQWRQTRVEHSKGLRGWVLVKVESWAYHTNYCIAVSHERSVSGILTMATKLDDRCIDRCLASARMMC